MPSAVRTDLVGTSAIPRAFARRDCFAIRTADGVSLRVAQWPASAMPIQGTVLLLQGRAEFIEKYFETVDHFRARGFDVVSFDWRGQGGSERLLRNPRKGPCAALLRLLSRSRCGLRRDGGMGRARKPWFSRRAFHGRGRASRAPRTRRNAGAACRADLSDDRLLADDRASLCDRARHHALRLRLGAILHSGRRSWLDHRQALRNNRLSTDLARYERNAAILSERARSRDRRSDRRLDRFRLPYDARLCPIRIFRAGSRRLCSSSRAETIAWSSTQATERFASRLKTGSAIVIVGARHELLMESDFFRDQALAAIDAFIPGGEASMRDGERAASAA